MQRSQGYILCNIFIGICILLQVNAKKFFFLIFVLIGAVFAADRSDWMDETIEQEFTRYLEKGICLEKLDKDWSKIKSRKEFGRYQVIKSKVYGPKSSIRDLLEVMVERYPVPDVDFIYYHGDIILTRDRKELGTYNFQKKKFEAPIFVSAKEKWDDKRILFIDWYYYIKENGTGWNRLIQNINDYYIEYPWNAKREIALWRGASVDGIYELDSWTKFPRGYAVYLCQSVCPDLVDAGFTRYWKFTRKEDEMAMKKVMGLVAEISPVDQMYYKYLIDIDGVTCTYPSLQWKLLTGSCVLKQVTSDIMWFYKELKPWVHYVPLKEDLSDLPERVMWVRIHDAEAREIGENGRKFVLEHIMPEDIVLYCYKTLKKYASLQKFKPKKP
jgi:hypothetical protein